MEIVINNAPCKGILLSLVREYPSNGILSGLHAKALADGVESGRGGMGLVLGTRVKLGRTQHVWMNVFPFSSALKRPAPSIASLMVAAELLT
jgi:hypothetical protein